MGTTLNRYIVHDRIFFWCCIALVFLMPLYGRLLPPVISLMVLNWLVDGRFIKAFRGFFRNSFQKRMIAFSVIYFFYLLGMINTTNVESGLFDLEVKLSLLIFPLIFATTNASSLIRERIRYILFAFVAGCLMGCIFLLLHSADAMARGIQGSFVYTGLSWYFHPSYYSMYLTFAIAIIADYLFVQKNSYRRQVTIGLIILILFFFVMIFLLSSKAGIGSLILVTMYNIIIVIFKKRTWKVSLLLVISALIWFFGAFWIFSFAVDRFSRIGKHDQPAEKSSSTDERIMIWQTSVKIIEQHFFSGTGTGDVKDELLKSYKEQDLQEIFQQRLNAHSQYLQVFIALGVLGFLVFMATLLIPAVYAFRKDSFLYLMFFIIIITNFLVESMLEVQAGVVFYAFFNCILFLWTKETVPANSSRELSS